MNDAEVHEKGGDAAPYLRDVARVLAELAVDPTAGLTGREAAERHARFGPNALRAAPRRPVLAIFIDQFRSVVVLLLLAAGVLGFVFGDHAEGLAIFAVIAINAGIGFVTEWRAIRSMEALERLGTVETAVVRDGQASHVPAEELVPGDIVLLEGGDIVTADLRLIEAARLQADESTLTGESTPVSKTVEALGADVPIMERHNMVFKGTALTRGSGRGVVTAIGFDTELGRISELVAESEAQQTPLEKRLDALARRLVGVVAVLAALIAAAGLVAGRDTFLAIEVAIALAVAAIPEGLPIVATIALARGMWRMAARQALIAKLSAVETLGATSVILTDKTGTLTENRMTVTAVRLADGEIAPGRAEADAGTTPRLAELLTTAALCSNASIQRGDDGEATSVGDPTEVALLRAALEHGIERKALLAEAPEISEFAFDPDTKLMATVHETAKGTLFAVKGAPEAVLPICAAVQTADGADALDDSSRSAWLDYAHELGARGLRTLAIARKTGPSDDADPYSGLTLLGVAGLEDPPRAGVKEAIERCRAAGIKVVMVTGDHAATARNIAQQLGIVEVEPSADQLVGGHDLDGLLAGGATDRLREVRVFSRVSPEQKLALIDLYQQLDQVVAMTGDGVNDAPALKKADIGVAMGLRGTDVAKEAAAMVLKDDAFATIVEAVAQGRAIYENIRKFVVYLMSCNISEVLVVALATAAGAPLPLLPLQILFLNLVTDVFPALALGVGEGSPALMQARPRPSGESILTRTHWLRILLHGSVIAAAVLGAMAIAAFGLGYDAGRAVTVSFCTLALAQLWHVFNMRDAMRRPFDNEIIRNPWIWAAIALCVVLILAAVYVPGLSDVLSLGDPGPAGWIVIGAMSLVPVVVAPVVRRLAPGHTPHETVEEEGVPEP